MRGVIRRRYRLAPNFPELPHGLNNIFAAFPADGLTERVTGSLRSATARSNAHVEEAALEVKASIPHVLLEVAAKILHCVRHRQALLQIAAKQQTQQAAGVRRALSKMLATILYLLAGGA